MTDEPQAANIEKPPLSAEEYDQKIKLLCCAYDELSKLSYCCLSAVLPREASILVAGAGTGAEIVQFARLKPDWSFCGVDPSGEMLALARRKIRANNLGNCIRLVEGYVDDLGTGEAFDGAACIMVLYFLKDDGAKLGFLRSISERLKRGAPLVLIDGCGDPGSRAFDKAAAYWKEYPIMHGVDPGLVDKIFHEQVMKTVHFVPEPRMVELLEEAGFTDIFKFYSGFLYTGLTACKR